MNNDELKKKIDLIFTDCFYGEKLVADALIAAGIGDVKEAQYRAEIIDLALDKMAEFVYETSAEREMWKKEFIKQAEKELAEERKDD